MTIFARPPCDVGVVLDIAGPTPCEASRRKWVLAATILGSSMAFIDGTAVNVALPVLQSELGGTASQMQWVVESYALFLAALLLVGGAMGDRLGRRRVFAWGIGIFAVGSIWAGVAPDALQLILARALQGVGGALLVPGSLAIIGASFSQEDRGAAIGTWAGATAITASLGPVLGGWLVEFSWRWVFFINIPVAAIVLFMLFVYVDESRDPDATGGFDIPGTLFGALGLGLLVFGLIESAELGLGHPVVIGTVAGGLGALGLFLLAESRGRAPMMPLNLFRSASFSGANSLTFLLYGAFGGALFYLPFNLVQVQGYTPVAAGAAFLPIILMVGVLSRWAGSLATRIGPRLPLTVGPLLVAVGFLLLAVPGTDASYWSTIFPASLILGLGMAVSVSPLSTVVMGSVGDQHAGVASGINNAISRTAGLIGLAVMGVIVVGAFNSGLDERLQEIDAPAAVVAQLEDERVNLAGARTPEGLSPRLEGLVAQAIDDSFIRGFRISMIVAAGMAAIASAIGFVSLRGREAAVGRVPQPST